MGIPIARIFGIEIRVPIGWTVVLALVAVIAVGQLTEVDPDLPTHIAWALGAIVALGFFISSLSHDLAHAIVARRRGVDVKSIGVSFFGGSTPFDPASPDPRHDVAIAASGPIVSLAIGGVLFAIAGVVFSMGEPYEAAAGVLAVLVFLNLVLGLVNLVPAYPLDGGRIIRDLAWRRSGSERLGWQVAARTGRVSGLMVIAAGIAILFVDASATGAMVALTGWFLILSANSVRDRVRLDELVGDFAVRDAMEPSPVTVAPSLTVDTFATQLLDGESALSAVPVVRGDEVVGLLGVGQVRRIRRRDWPNTRVEDVMARPPKLPFIAPGDALRDALEQMHRQSLDGLPVLEDGRLVGILTRRGVGLFMQSRQAPATPETATDDAIDDRPDPPAPAESAEPADHPKPDDLAEHPEPADHPKPDDAADPPDATDHADPGASGHPDRS
jgi:Zn-dependent protease/CBS domain-containing protein